MGIEELRDMFKEPLPAWERVQEIRVRIGRPVLFRTDDGELELKISADRRLLRELLGILSKHSLYAFEDEVRQGFLTIEGGHRVGIAGKTVLYEAGEGPLGAIKTIRDISALNIRLSHEKKGCADVLLPYLYNRNGEVESTLLISPPGAGKTTMLRDLIRRISDGTDYGPGLGVSVVDERSELGACFQGVPQCDLGRRTDILDACPKAAGMLMMLRSMAPGALAVDEIGTAADLEAMRYVANCGCALLATVHGAAIKDLEKKPVFAELMEDRIFSRYVVLKKKPHPGSVAGIYDAERKEVRSVL
ncbi:MAG: stage III sporulation protein AA [Lachnospiraceae bacterium]|nr:stage III sporulation protein AA [Lachnospiraceae bacterium]